ncbi:MAG TPA: type 3 dihydrofolate reductase [Gammaproteobacteria bacterium]|nr:type 3 dihydrofolate reductase [Gammaproteobacteria bacterium]
MSHIALIAAMGENRVIGLENRLPWHLPADMAWFRRHTLGKPVLMGRKTFESIGRPLPGRCNIVVSRDPAFHPEGVLVAPDIEKALGAAGSSGEVMVIGGASFYRQLLPRAQRLYLTLVHGRFDGDAFFPEYRAQDWREIFHADHEADDDNPWSYSFLILTRVR